MVCFAIPVVGAGCSGESGGERSGLRFEGSEAGDCTDDADNDADGLFDCNDPGCAGSAACSGGSGGTSGMGGTGGMSGTGGTGTGGMVGTGGMAGTGGVGGEMGGGGAGGLGGDSGMGGVGGTAGLGGMGGDTGSGGAGGVGGTGGAGNTGGNACQSITITPSRSIPNVMFLVDQSGSMDAPFGSSGENRWEAGNTVINDIVASTDSIVRYGLTTYTSDDGDQNLPCPRLPTQIDFALDNSINVGNDSLYPYTYPTDAGSDTPTGDSIDGLVSVIQSSPPPNEGPTIIVLATDGLPDSCEFPDPIDGAQRAQAEGEAVTAAGAAHAAGIDVFALWVGDLSSDPSDPTRSHMQDVADAGIGGTGTVYVGDDSASLSQAFSDIISNSISCDIAMDQPFDDKVKACNEGDVRLDGEQLPCSDTDGWRVKLGEDQVIELVGTACDTLKTGDVTFSAEFPCGAVIVE
jgi:hypothetical protein